MQNGDFSPNRLTESDWRLLLGRIDAGKCTPFLGAGACAEALPVGSKIAQLWSQRFGYPLQDTHNLARVAQYLAVQHDPMFPKEEILRQFFQDIAPPDFSAPGEAHRVLAELPLPIYMTTNYDSFMVQALQRCGKNPHREACCWNKWLESYPSILHSDPYFEPTVANPLVFHLHGHDGVAESLVLTEDDYLDFLVNTSRNADMLPHQIQRALSGTSLLFVGYSLEDWTFKVLYRGLVTSTDPSMRRISVTVQLEPPELIGEVHLTNGDKITGRISEQAEGRISIDSPTIGVVSIKSKDVERVIPRENNGKKIREKQQEYLQDYFSDKAIKVYWGTAQEFVADLKARWEEYKGETRDESANQSLSRTATV